MDEEAEYRTEPDREELALLRSIVLKLQATINAGACKDPATGEHIIWWTCPLPAVYRTTVTLDEAAFFNAFAPRH